MEKNDSVNLLETVSTVVITLAVFLLPVFFLTNSTDFFTIPKQLLITSTALLLLVLWGLKTLTDKKIVINNNPLNLPIFIFGVVITISAFLARNRFDALIQTVPTVAAILFFFLIVNSIRERKAFSVVLTGYILGAAVSSILTILYFFNVFFLPIPEIQSQFFNSFGSIVQQLLYLIPAFVFTLLYIGRRINFPKIKLSSQTTSDVGFFIQVVAGVIVAAGIGLIIYQIVALPNKPVLLPYIYGFQTVASAISQDAQRFIISLLFGSGYGTFIVDFTRFKPVGFNIEPNIWNLSFSFSSSYFLELVATTGILGVLSYIFIIISTLRTRTAKNPIFAALFILFVLSIILPFSFVLVAALFILAGIYVAYLNIEEDKRVYDVSLSLMSSKKSLLSFETNPDSERTHKGESPVFSIIALVITLVIAGYVGYWTYNFAISDITFAKSLRELQGNNAEQTYELETRAIQTFPYRSDYHRIFSQVNVALANSLAGSIQEGSSPSAEVQQNILGLLQQGIDYGRNAVVLSPQTSTNWQNLAQVYRSLIGVGQNAEQFAIASMNQAIALDPYNPQLYIQLGGIYYQLEQYPEAQRSFELAVQFKQDFSNGYYNLGHALEQQGDLQGALTAYQIVRQLSEGNEESLSVINPEIEALQARIGEEPQEPTEEREPETDQTPLGISGPQTQIPPRDPQVEISPPPDGEASPSAE